MAQRLFVPLKSIAFDWFKSGGKRWELRRYGRAYTSKQLVRGRPVELRRGYCGESLWGVIGDSVIGSSLNDILDVVDFRLIVPAAQSREDACGIVQSLFVNAEAGYVAFEVTHLSSEQAIATSHDARDSLTTQAR
jgi:hypothetical protein